MLAPIFWMLLLFCTVSFLVTGGSETIRCIKILNKNNLPRGINILIRYGLKDIALSVISFYGIIQVSLISSGNNSAIWNLMGNLPGRIEYMLLGFLVGVLTGVAVHKTLLYIELIKREYKGENNVKSS